LGGQISVTSQAGEGTTFRIVLPARPNDEAQSNANETPSTPPRSAPRARVLVVDDEVAIGNTLRDLLSIDHDVVAVASGEAALELIARDSFDVVFCDLMMPRVSGIDIYE